MKTKTPLVLFLVIGSFLVGISFFVGHTGFTLHISWNIWRISLLILGVTIFLLAFLYDRYKDILWDETRKAEYAIEYHPFTLWWENAQYTGKDGTSKSKKIYLITSILSFLIILIYLWFVSAGKWTVLAQTTNYYDQLASSFQKGHLFLSATPSPALLALSNPYDPIARINIQTPIDVSLYNGKFYLYFGSVPALILAIIKQVIYKEIGDQYIVFVSIIGIYVFQCLLILSLWNRFFRHTPIWTVLICILLTGLVNPLLYMLVTARVYEASITAGQFFFAGGLYFAVTAIDTRSFSLGRLALAGQFWACALGSRMILALPIGFMSLMVLFWIIKTSCQAKTNQTIQAAAAFILTFALGIACLGWYNYARFDSVFETGFNYQLLAINLQKEHKNIFTFASVPQNLYNYLLNPPRTLGTFPFISANSANKKNSIIPFIKLPEIYNGEQITGLIYSVPFSLFAIIPFISLFAKSGKLHSLNEVLEKNNCMNFINWISIGLMGSFILAFAPLLLFFWATMRYMGDFIPSLILLSIIGFWQGYEYFTQNRIQGILYSFMGFCLACISISISGFLTFAINLWWLRYT